MRVAALDQYAARRGVWRGAGVGWVVDPPAGVDDHQRTSAGVALADLGGGMGGGADMARLKAMGGGRLPEPDAEQMKALQDRLSGLGGGQIPGGLPGLPGLPTKKT